MVVYVFDVIRGKLLDFSALTAADRVSSLKDVLSRVSGVDQQHQILLEYEGALLAPNEPLSSFSAGQQPENPVYFFDFKALGRNATVDVHLPGCLLAPIPALTVQGDLRQALEGHRQLAVEYHRAAQEAIGCARLYFSALAHQKRGYEAALNNVQIYVRKLKESFDSFHAAFQQITAVQQPDQQIVQRTENLLARIPLAAAFEVADSATLLQCQQRHDDVLSDNLTEFARVRSRLEEQHERFEQAVSAIMQQATHLLESELILHIDAISDRAEVVFRHQTSMAETVVNQSVRAREPGADRAVLQEFARNHIQIGVKLQEQDNMLRDLLHQLSNMKQEFAHLVRTRLQAVMKIQQLVKVCKRDHSVHGYFEACSKVNRLENSITAGLRLPHTYVQALREIARRLPFAAYYNAVVGKAVSRLSRIREREIEMRRLFHEQHGQFLPDWPEFNCLQDHPHTCVVKPRDFDTALPAVSLDDARQVLHRILSDADSAGLLDQVAAAWGCCSNVRQLEDIDTRAFALTRRRARDESDGASEGSDDDDNDNADATDSHHQQQLAELQDQVLQLHCECEILQEQNDALKANSARMREQREELEAAHQQALAQVQERDAELVRLQSERETQKNAEALAAEASARTAALQAEVNALREQLATADGLRLEAEERLANHSKTMQLLTDSTSDARDRARQLQDENAVLRQKVKNLEDAQALSAGRLQDLDARCAEAETRCSAAEARGAELQAARQALETQHAAAEAAAQAQTSQVQRQLQELEALRGDLAALRLQEAEARDRAAAAETARDQMLRDLQTSQDTCTQLDAEVKSMQARAQDHARALREAQERIAVLSAAAEAAKVRQEKEKVRAKRQVEEDTVQAALSADRLIQDQPAPEPVSLGDSVLSESTLTTSVSAVDAPKLSFRSFQVGDLALFIPWKKHYRSAYHRGAPYRIMSQASMHALNITDAVSKPIVARIVQIQVLQASESYNPYGLDLGTRFYELDVEKY
eukprot:m.222801 g.222801  ORF g.222801 m.222801 type:complete len:997 (+) comp22310_c1_seq3:553-3543(+)